jgi:hypothetical protein
VILDCNFSTCDGCLPIIYVMAVSLWLLAAMIDDTNWTVVVNKRRTRHPPPPNHGVMTLAPSPSHRPLKEIEYSSCSEDLIMSKLKRSMERVEKSEFFGRFLEQLQNSSNGLARRLSFQGMLSFMSDETIRSFI